MNDSAARDEIASDDRGLLLGDGLFETVLAQSGRLIAFEAHAARLVAGCAVLGLPAPAPATLAKASQAALKSAGLELARAAVRWTWTSGSGGRGLDRPEAVTPRLLVTAAPSPAPSGPIRLITATVPRNAASPAARLKTLSYLDNVLARREARQAGADEALMLSTQGHIACAAAANLFWIVEGRLFTPSLDCGVLDGIARAATLEAARSAGIVIEEVQARSDVLAGAEALFLTNSLIGVRAVIRLDDRVLTDHPMTRELAERVRAGWA